MFEASHSFLPFDYHRVPYTVATGVEPELEGFACLRRIGEEPQRPSLHWALARDTKQLAAARTGEFVWDGSHIFGSVISDDDLRAKLPADRDWRPLSTITGETGTAASVWISSGGDIVLPFDPDEVIQNFWSEAYLGSSEDQLKSKTTRLARQLYYRARPLMPRAVQIRLRRGYSRLQARPSFPQWPVESSLHDSLARLLALSAAVGGEALPAIAAWPRGHTWAAVLTHDVETAVGRDHIGPVVELEQARGLRSSWNLVPKRYDVSTQTVNDLKANGFEIGVHGLKHDGRDFESLKTFNRRLPEIRRYAERWQSVGFRAPSTHRVWDWMPRLGFDYDTSYPDSDPFEPQSGGCCSWLPFFNQNMVELPITLVQDHTMFVILGEATPDQWLTKAAALRERGGMALVIVHPDYMLEPGRLEAYGQYLDMLASDPSVWNALPRDVAAWWRRRAASSLVQGEDGEWTCTGPAAAEAAIAWIEPDAAASPEAKTEVAHAQS